MLLSYIIKIISNLLCDAGATSRSPLGYSDVMNTSFASLAIKGLKATKFYDKLIREERLFYQTCNKMNLLTKYFVY